VPRTHAWAPIFGDGAPFDPAPWVDFADCILWGANHFAHRLPPSAGWLIWDKNLGAKRDDFSECEIAWHKRGTRARMFRRLWNGLLAREQGERRLSVAQKPIDLMQWCVGFVTAPTIIDPYMGSGATGLACLALSKRFIGIEIDRSTFDLACARLDAAHRQGRLFAPPASTPQQQALALKDAV
jgi:DNA modification methylase